MDRNEAYRAAAEKGVIMLTEEEELKLLAPIDEHGHRTETYEWLSRVQPTG